MRAGYLLSPDAKDDLRNLWAHLAHASGETTADHLERRLEEAMRRLVEYPWIGHERQDLANQTLRVYTVQSFLNIYEPGTSPLWVVRVLHGAGDLRMLDTDRGLPRSPSGS